MNDKNDLNQANELYKQLQINNSQKINALLEKLLNDNYQDDDVIELKKLLDYPLEVNELEKLVKGCIASNPKCLKAIRECVNEKVKEIKNKVLGEKIKEKIGKDEIVQPALKNTRRPKN
ncbi:hypothetical protein [Vibrio sp. FF145]|uniref:hypothetical protein n=1 Tax=Vibrio sp. FF145 TaxID=3230013 RepID=UPI00352BF34C